MTGNDVFKRALNLLGYQNSHNLRSNNESLLKVAHDVINQMCQDLKIPQINRLSDKIVADDKAFDALCFGSAMMFSLIEGDTAINKVFTDIYNAKRASALSSKEIVEDKMPTISYGVD